MRFTETIVSRIEPPDGKGEGVYFDDALPRFGVKVKRTTNGFSRHYIVQAKYAGKVRRYSLARCEELTLAKARENARDHFELLRKGIDPAAEKAREIEKENAAITLKEAVDQYLEVVRRRLRPSTISDVERYLLRTWRHLHGKPVASIRRSDITRHVEKIDATGKVVAARQAVIYLSTFFKWCQGHEMVELNPCDGVAKPPPPKARDRNLSEAEIARVWAGCEKVRETSARKGDYGDFARIVQLLLLTGARRNEVAGLVWGEIDLDQATWTLPAVRSKNRREHVVPLTPAALAIIGDRPVAARDDISLFGRFGAFSGYSKGKKALDAEIARNGPMSPWTLHDLRRTFATGCAELGIEPHIVEAALNHVSGHKGGVAGIYNRANYAIQKRKAMVQWAEHVSGLTGAEGAKIVHLRRESDTVSASA